MSMKIYDAWKFNGSHNDLIKFIGSLRKLYLEDCKVYIDSITPDLPELDRYEYIRHIQKKINEGINSVERGYPYDIDASGVVLEFDGKIVIYFFNLNEHQYPKTWKKIREELEFFGYWDNVDPDENCSEDEWNERKEFFNNLFEEYESYVPSDCGLIFEFYRQLEIFSVVDKIARKRKGIHS